MAKLRYLQNKIQLSLGDISNRKIILAFKLKVTIEIKMKKQKKKNKKNKKQKQKQNKDLKA